MSPFEWVAYLHHKGDQGRLSRTVRSLAASGFVFSPGADPDSIIAYCASQGAIASESEP